MPPLPDRQTKIYEKAIDDDKLLMKLDMDLCKGMKRKHKITVAKAKRARMDLVNSSGICRNRFFFLSSFIQLPVSIQNKKAVINSKNTDEKCFKWAILAKNITEDHSYRVSKKYIEYANKYDFNGLTYPTPLSDIKKFEKNNLIV
ncbi:Hypothetical protein CINCED_3A024909, partial [Cinara cedri]